MSRKQKNSNGKMVVGNKETAMQANQETIPFSIGYYWINGAGTGVWRTARQNHLCKGGKRGEHYISKGERFLDTGERTPGSVWATYKCCRTCADSRAVSIYGDGSQSDGGADHG